MSEEQKQKFFTWDEILKLDCLFNVAIGQRGPGKSTDSLHKMVKWCLTKTTRDGHPYQGAIIRRNKEDFIGKRGQAMFSTVIAQRWVEKYSKGKYNTIIYYGSRWYFATTVEEEDKNGNIIEKTYKADEPFCYGFDLSTYYHDKSTSFPYVRTILFDEFIADPNVQDYLPDETRIFYEVLSTIIRRVEDEKQFREYKVFICGNSLNIYCPYFKLWGIRDIKDIKPGEVRVYDYKDANGNPVLMKLALCITDTQITKDNLISHMFAFNSPTMNLLTGNSDTENGIWLLNQSPKCPVPYTPDDIEFEYFIRFDGEQYKCSVIVLDDCTFTFINPHNRRLLHEEDTLIFDPLDDSPLPNHRKYIQEADNKFLKWLYSYYQKHLVYYSDNMTANAINSYLKL